MTENKQPEVQEIEITEEQFFENVVPGLSKEEYQKIREEALEKAKNAKHNWVQKGNEIICTSCEYPHGSYIPHDVRLVGIDNSGLPVFEKI